MNDEPAFPVPNVGMTTKPGMMLRDYFAAKVISGFFTDRPPAYFLGPDLQALTRTAYEIADAMMVAREETKR